MVHVAVPLAMSSPNLAATTIVLIAAATALHCAPDAPAYTRRTSSLLTSEQRNAVAGIVPSQVGRIAFNSSACSEQSP